MPARMSAGTARASDSRECGGAGLSRMKSRTQNGRIIALVVSLNATLYIASVWIGWSGFSRRGERLPSRTRQANSNASHDIVRWLKIMKVRKYAAKSARLYVVPALLTAPPRAAIAAD